MYLSQKKMYLSTLKIFESLKRNIRFLLIGRLISHDFGLKQLLFGCYSFSLFSRLALSFVYRFVWF